jgi:predicted nucleic acid-binding protein
MSRIYWDTMLFAYWIEENPVYEKQMRHIISRMKERSDKLFTSTFTLGEILVGPYKMRAAQTAQRIRDILRPPAVELIPLTSDAAGHYANIRATQRVSPPDAIHLACAAQAGIDLFLTNDHDLLGKIVPGIQFIAGLDTNII